MSCAAGLEGPKQQPHDISRRLKGCSHILPIPKPFLAAVEIITSEHNLGERYSTQGMWPGNSLSDLPYAKRRAGLGNGLTFEPSARHAPLG